MIYRHIQPRLHLKKYVKDYLLIHFVFDKNENIPIKPYPARPKQGIIFYIKGFLISSTPEMGISEKRAQTVIFGQHIYRQNLHLPEDYIAISIRFQPGALYKFLHIPMTEFLNKNIDAELIFGNEIRDVNNHLSNTISYENMIDIVEAFLWKRIRKLKEEIHPIDKMGQLLLDNYQFFSLDKFAHQACLSTSQFERRFIRQIGVPPKYFSRICRFYQAFHLKEHNPHQNWLSIALQSGYNDYQHLVKDFKTFSGVTPNTLIEENTQSPEKWLGLKRISNSL